MPNLNKGVNVDKLLRFRHKVEADPTQADRNKVFVAEWVGGDEAQIDYGGRSINIGGDNPNAMEMLLMAFAACDIDVIAMHCSFIGIKIRRLSIEARGHYNVQSYLGIEGTPGSGYDDISYTIHLDAPGISNEDMAYLRERLEKSSPVGDSLGRMIPMRLEFEAG